MKLTRVVALCSAIALPQLVLADQPGTQQGLDIIHGVLIDYCAKVDPRDASKFETIWEHVLSQTPDRGGYKPGFQLSGPSDAGAPKLCSELAAGVTESEHRRTNGKEDRPGHE